MGFKLRFKHVNNQKISSFKRKMSRNKRVLGHFERFCLKTSVIQS